MQTPMFSRENSKLQMIETAHVNKRKHAFTNQYPVGDDVSTLQPLQRSAASGGSTWNSKMPLDSQRRPYSRCSGPSTLQPRVNRLTFQRQNGECALMKAAKKLAFHKTLQRFHPHSKFSQSERALRPRPTRPQSFQVLRCRVLRSVDDSEVFFPPSDS